MPSQREQYGNTVHLFIGMGRSPCKITLMPFTFINNSIIILRGLIWLFIFKSVSLSRRYAEALLHIASWSSYPSSWSPSQSSFVLIMLLYTRNLTSKVPVHIFLLENIVKLRFWGPSEAEGPQHLLWLQMSWEQEMGKKKSDPSARAQKNTAKLSLLVTIALSGIGT
jgi:hypothetical protein